MTGFVPIHPHLAHERTCPRCGGQASATDWSVPGQWTMARYRCSGCGFDCWADLPFNLGVLSPCFIDTATGEVTRPCGPEWYASLTRAAWKQRGHKPVQLTRIVNRPVRRATLVNALGNCWGDALATLAKLNALDGANGLDVVVLTTANMAPHVPATAAETWLIDGSHADTAFWNDALADAVKKEVARFEACYVPAIFQLPSVTPAEVQALSGIAPFDRTRWDMELERRPTVTFAWRDDRCWSNELTLWRRLIADAERMRGGRRAVSLLRRLRPSLDVSAQHRRVVQLAQRLRAALPKLDFAVCGEGTYGSFPEFMQDLRAPRADAAANARWCERAARSHLLIGVLGSQMVLPSGHAGAVIDLVPAQYLRNVLTDLLVTADDVREAMFLYRTLPLATPARAVADTAISMLVNYSCARSSLHGSHYKPLASEAIDQLVSTQTERARILEQAVADDASHLIGP
jgi:hypothetical protein